MRELVGGVDEEDGMRLGCVGRRGQRRDSGGGSCLRRRDVHSWWMVGWVGKKRLWDRKRHDEAVRNEC